MDGGRESSGGSRRLLWQPGRCLKDGSQSPQGAGRVPGKGRLLILRRDCGSSLLPSRWSEKQLGCSEQSQPYRPAEVQTPGGQVSPASHLSAGHSDVCDSRTGSEAGIQVRTACMWSELNKAWPQCPRFPSPHQPTLGQEPHFRTCFENLCPGLDWCTCPVLVTKPHIQF